jgi:hypothetical protein
MRYSMTAISYYQNIQIHHVVKILTADAVKMTRPYIQIFLFYKNQTKSLDILSQTGHCLTSLSARTGTTSDVMSIDDEGILSFLSMSLYKKEHPKSENKTLVFRHCQLKYHIFSNLIHTLFTVSEG